MAERRQYVTLAGPEGEPWRLPVREGGGWGNKHYNHRRPQGPVCHGCGAPWELVCPTWGCPVGRETRRLIRAEKQDRNTRFYGPRRGA